MDRRFFLSLGLFWSACRSSAPLKPGDEEDLYFLFWRGLRVGIARLSQQQKIDSQHFTFDFDSAGALGLLRPIHRHIDARASLTLDRSLSYQESGGKHRKSLDFDWPQKQIRRYRDDVLRQTLPQVPLCLDPLSLIYALRRSDLTPGRTLSFLLSDGKKVTRVTARIESHDLKGRPCFLIRPDMADLDGLLRLGDAEASLSLWIEDKPERHLLRIDASSKWGEISALKEEQSHD